MTLAFIAEFSRGKTELINAMFFSGFKQRLLPSNVGRTTMCPTEIFYDPSEEPYIKLLPIETRKRQESVGALKRQSKTVIKGEEGTWQLNLMVFLNAAPGANAINIVYYDLSKKNEQVDFAEVPVKPDQKIILLNGQTVSKEKGFVKGHTYDIRATRVVGGKEKVLAKATITLK